MDKPKGPLFFLFSCFFGSLLLLNFNSYYRFTHTVYYEYKPPPSSPTPHPPSPPRAPMLAVSGTVIGVVSVASAMGLQSRHIPMPRKTDCKDCYAHLLIYVVISSKFKTPATKKTNTSHVWVILPRSRF